MRASVSRGRQIPVSSRGSTSGLCAGSATDTTPVAVDGQAHAQQKEPAACPNGGVALRHRAYRAESAYDERLYHRRAVTARAPLTLRPDDAHDMPPGAIITGQWKSITNLWKAASTAVVVWTAIRSRASLPRAYPPVPPLSAKD